MKLFKKYLFLFIYSGISIATMGQSSRIADKKRIETNGDWLAQYMAGKMKDSLGLTKQQAYSIYLINMKLHDQKMKARKQIQERVLLTKLIQGIENSRDSLYIQVLPPASVGKYIDKKRKLISGS